MITVDIQDATIHLSMLIDRAVKGEPFIIAKAGKPLVRVAALKTPATRARLGFLAGEIEVPEDFDTMTPAAFDRL